MSVINLLLGTTYKHIINQMLHSLQHDIISNLLSSHSASYDVFELYCTYDITILQQVGPLSQAFRAA